MSTAVAFRFEANSIWVSEGTLPTPGKASVEPNSSSFGWKGLRGPGDSLISMPDRMWKGMARFGSEGPSTNSGGVNLLSSHWKLNELRREGKGVKFFTQR